MAKFRTLGWISAIVAISTCLPTMVEALTVTPPFITGFTTANSSKDQVLLNSSPTWTADLTTFNTFKGQVHSLLGYEFTDGMGGGGNGFADLEHQEDDGPDPIHGDIALPYAMVGRHADGQNATVLYKFVVESGYQTAAGSTISANVYFRHDPDSQHGDNAWIGVNPTASIPTELYNLLNDVSFQKVSMRTRFGGAAALHPIPATSALTYRPVSPSSISPSAMC